MITVDVGLHHCHVQLTTMLYRQSHMEQNAGWVWSLGSWLFNYM